ncbi:unnamed protein product [Alopecurus aequalis]
MTVDGARRVGLLFCLIVSAAARHASAGDGLLLNGNFEDPPNKSQMNGTTMTGAHAIPYWTITGIVEYIDSGKSQAPDGVVLAVPEGVHALRLGNGASVHQQLSLARGFYYSVTFSASRTCAQSEKLILSVVPGDAAAEPTSEIPIQTVYSVSGWDSYSWAFRAARGVVTFVIHHGDEGVDDPDCGPIIDAVAIKKLRAPHETWSGAGGNLLSNGDFEEGPYIIPGTAYGVLVPPMDEDDVSPLPGWMVMSYSKVVKYVDAAHYKVPKGARAVELVAGVEVALVQEVDTVPGSACKMEFSVGDAGDGCVAHEPELPMRVVAATTGAPGTVTVVYQSQGTGGHTSGKLEFTADGNRTRVVLYSSGYHTMSDGTGTLCGPVVDDVSLVCASLPPHTRRLLRR